MSVCLGLQVLALFGHDDAPVVPKEHPPVSTVWAVGASAAIRQGGCDACIAPVCRRGAERPLDRLRSPWRLRLREHMVFSTNCRSLFVCWCQVDDGRNSRVGLKTQGNLGMDIESLGDVRVDTPMNKSAAVAADLSSEAYAEAIGAMDVAS